MEKTEQKVLASFFYIIGTNPRAAAVAGLPVKRIQRLAILQFTSGSTAAPKGVMLPDRCVGANIDAIIAGAQLTHADRAVSWLPLYHDMGLIGAWLGVAVDDCANSANATRIDGSRSKIAVLVIPSDEELFGKDIIEALA